MFGFRHRPFIADHDENVGSLICEYPWV